MEGRTQDIIAIMVNAMKERTNKAIGEFLESTISVKRFMEAADVSTKMCVNEDGYVEHIIKLEFGEHDVLAQSMIDMKKDEIRRYLKRYYKHPEVIVCAKGMSE